MANGVCNNKVVEDIYNLLNFVRFLIVFFIYFIFYLNFYQNTFEMQKLTEQNMKNDAYFIKKPK